MKVNEKLIEQITPKFDSSNWKEREWFDNDSILSELSQEELKSVEVLLIEKMKTDYNSLIPETLIKLNSLDAIPVLLDIIKSMKDPFERIQWATYINDLQPGDKVAEQIAFEDFRRLEFIYAVQGSVFIYLKKFKSKRINEHIENFIDHKYDLVAHHAKHAINYNGYADNYDNSRVYEKNGGNFGNKS